MAAGALFWCAILATGRLKEKECLLVCKEKTVINRPSEKRFSDGLSVSKQV
ncbi:hypothetical protein HMPREF9123_1472 [Neisseria bacilliformis ATCC BAA-1200]|uniref:Uncharacterized protein n=1 Tax=Neisseria bacilliformis ATCC BAA-1200 TaxID=888742 RepID=F2BCP7_9NEIS|nr:hypothetical protein HMPREF9123_1472 [Neisseria bacilliformis ATCC BAA-1200]